MLRDLFADYMTKLELPKNQGGLGIRSMLGLPTTGRVDVLLPVSAVAFARDDVGVTKRLGAIPAPGRLITVALHLFADTEMELIGLVDDLAQTKQKLTGMSVGGVAFVVRYGPTERQPFDQENPLLAFSTTTEVTFATATNG